ncbi:hypothetical protein K439DRAFT_1618201 [Ramaria rubella]|nr:hypothetical protein K439DRAFT_1618201 [Ramaria rubella]
MFNGSILSAVSSPRSVKPGKTPGQAIARFLAFLWCRGSVDLGQRGSPDVALNAEVVVHSANHKSTAELHAALGNLYGMVGILLSLSVLNKRDHLEKVMEAVLLLSFFNRQNLWTFTAICGIKIFRAIIM